MKIVYPRFCSHEDASHGYTVEGEGFVVLEKTSPRTSTQNTWLQLPVMSLLSEPLTERSSYSRTQQTKRDGFLEADSTGIF